MRKIKKKLLFVLTLFSIILVTVMSLATHVILISDVERQQDALQINIENQIITDLEIMDRAHRIFRENETEDMKEGLMLLREYYDENPDIYSWDLDYVTERYKMDFYILNKDGQIVVTTHEPSRNMDFNDYSKDLVKLIQERIQTDEFYYDGLEVSFATKKQRMYGYLATSDHKYLLEFGINFHDTLTAKGFGYEHTVESLLANYQDLEDLRVLTHNGFVLNNEPGLFTYEDFNPDLQEAFLTVAHTNQSSEITNEFNKGNKITHRFIPYHLEDADGNVTERIIYAEYRNVTEQQLIKQSVIQFLIMIFIGVVTSVVCLLIILRVLNNTFYLATFDALTGAYNRASYLRYIDTLIHNKKDYPIGLMLIDLDNFKLVNDGYGHTSGDTALREVTNMLKEVAGPNGYVVRYGGDEFLLVFEKATPEILHDYAKRIQSELCNRNLESQEPFWSSLKMSIGYTIQKEPHEQESNLFQRADQAMYLSKNKGKDTWTYVAPDATITIKNT